MSQQQSHDLFRQEALAARADNSAGPALHIRPVGANRLTAFFAAMALSVVALLIFGSYTKKERVQGAIQARDGVAMIVPPEAGVVSRVMVKDGDHVKAGQAMLAISHGRTSAAGDTHALLAVNLENQRQQVHNQTAAQQLAHQASLATLDQRIAQGQRNADSVAAEIALQTQQVASSRKLIEQLKPLLTERIVSELQYEQQHQTLLDQTARLHGLQRQRQSALADVAMAREERQRLQAEHTVTQANLDRNLLSLRQEEVQRLSAQETILTAPIEGTATSLLVTPGQSVPSGAGLIAVVPHDSPMTAVLYVPSTAIGFVQAGQRVRLSYDAYPYQRFGQYQGVVQSVSDTDVPAAANPDKQDRRAYFLVRVKLDSSHVKAYDTEIPLRPGLTLTADIEIDRRSLIRWMLDPLFAFAGKL